jgi:uncharacterized protein (DUF924 family)
VLAFWFEDLPPVPWTRWFRPPDGFDDQVKSKFSTLVERARTSELDHWAHSPKGALALILVLDQFPRNIYRNSPLAFAADAKACDIATDAIAAGFDRQLSWFEQAFMYMPFMHAERLRPQILWLSLQESLLLRALKENAPENAVEFLTVSRPIGQRHLEVIRRFGRFCARNEVLGRESTEEEREFLKENPSGH